MVGVTDMDAEAALTPWRHQIDAVDEAVVALLARRVALVRGVVAEKARAGIAARLPDRVEAVIVHVRATAGRLDCPPDLAEAVWRTMIEWTIAYEEQHLPAPATPATGDPGR